MGHEHGQTGSDLYPARTDELGFRSISPTDISQYVRIEQCDRYLRLRLHERSGGTNFMREFGVVPQELPPLLTRSGSDFESMVETKIVAHHRTIHQGNTDRRLREVNNDAVVAAIRDLEPGQTIVILQPGIVAEIDGWRIRGDLDVLRLARSEAGGLQILIADIKSSGTVKVDQRLQVAFYHEMIATLLAAHDIPYDSMTMGILYRGPAEDAVGLDQTNAARLAAQRAEATRWFGTDDALLEIVEDPESYRNSVSELVTGSRSAAHRAAAMSFTDVPFHLGHRCDGCQYNQFCLKWSAERDDLSLIPHVAEREKDALLRAGVTTVRQLAHLKEFRKDPGQNHLSELVPTPATETLATTLGATWPIGPRIDELVHRARRYRKFKHDDLEWLSYIPSKGYGSLPYSDPHQNPNLVRVYLDAQNDYIHNRIYLLGSLVVGCEGGIEVPHRRRRVATLAARPPDSPDVEAALFVDWIRETLEAIAEVAALDAEGRPRAPIHLIFFDRFDQRLLLEGLGRHMGRVLAATPLYDFVTQLAAFDSPIATFLSEEIRELKNYPMLCQSLYTVAAHLKFDWNAGTRYREIFHERLFDFWGKLDEPRAEAPGESPWYFARARFGSDIPLEYAYTAWNLLQPPQPGKADPAKPFRHVTAALLRGFHERRLEALEHVAHDFSGNHRTEKAPFDLSTLATFEERARGLPEALHEFLTIERHVFLGSWKRQCLPPPERRVAAGNALLVRYVESDQEPGVAEINRDNESRRVLKLEQRAREAGGAKLSKEEKARSKWDQEGLRVRLRLVAAGTGIGLDEGLALTTLKRGESVVITPRFMVDSRLAVTDQVPFTPTPRKMLYSSRGRIGETTLERDALGRTHAAWIEVELQGFRSGDSRGYVFTSYPEPLQPDGVYSLDPDPNDWYGSWCAKVVDGLRAGEPNTLIDRLNSPGGKLSTVSRAAIDGQDRFLAGLIALNQHGALHGLEESKHEFIGLHGDSPSLLVQGPPGTGKSYSTAFAVLARVHGAMVAGNEYRVLVSCKTHAATDVLLDNLVKVRDLLGDLRRSHADVFDRYIDPGVLEVPLFRVQPRDSIPSGAVALWTDRDRPKDQRRAMDEISSHEWCVVATNPGGTYKAVKERWGQALFGHEVFDCLVLDEASQMNLPEAVMGALPLKTDGQLIVVGDHRQMPPIVQHGWDDEPRRTFQEYKTYESLFSALQATDPPVIRFAESFRLHADMAEYLRHEIYRRDGIPYHSRKRDIVATVDGADAFVTAALTPEHPLVVVVHDEAASQRQNLFEQNLVARIMRALSRLYTDSVNDLGVVVPHRAQRAALQEALPMLVERDADSGAVIGSAIDTVERFQGGERKIIVVSATESDRAYVLASSKFLLDPRRLTVALSRAKQKMILVASRSVFDLYSADEETFVNAQLWKNLLRRTCTVPLWSGAVDGIPVEVWGNVAGLQHKDVPWNDN